MSYATSAERFAAIQSNAVFNPCPFVVRVRKGERESELMCDDFEHAYNTAISWKHEHAAEYVEMFRVCEHDGNLFGGIGVLKTLAR